MGPRSLCCEMPLGQCQTSAAESRSPISSRFVPKASSADQIRWLYRNRKLICDVVGADQAGAPHAGKAGVL